VDTDWTATESWDDTVAAIARHSQCVFVFDVNIESGDLRVVADEGTREPEVELARAISPLLGALERFGVVGPFGAARTHLLRFEKRIAVVVTAPDQRFLLLGARDDSAIGILLAMARKLERLTEVT
jgi:hypothetical protein